MMAGKAKEGDKRIGNQFWKVRSKHGKDKIFKSPDILWEAACEYFKWCDANPLKEQKVFHTAGKITKTDANKMRAYTLKGLCIFLHVSSSYFRTFKSVLKEEDKDYLTVIHAIEEIIYTQKFAGAAADMLNPNIIARDLGLIDKQDVTSDGKELEALTHKSEKLTNAIIDRIKKKK